MSATVTGGPTHWRANLDELTLGVGQLELATEHTMRLAGKATVAGGLLAGVTILTPQGPLIGANTLGISTGLVAMRAEVETLSVGLEYAVRAYLEAEQQITNAVTAALTPMAVMLSIVGVTTDLNVPNDAYEIAIRGTTSAVWLPVETAFSVLDRSAPGTKYAAGNAIGWLFGLEQNIWDIPPTQRTYGMLAHSLGQFGIMNLAPYDTTNVTQDPAEHGWQHRDALDNGGSTKAMQLLKDYALEDDTVTVAKIEQSDGSDAYAVIYSGTTPLGDDSGPLGMLQHEAAFGATGVVESVVADSVHVADATMNILAQAGVPAGATVIPMGYSQGGTHAMNAGLNKNMKAKYKISDVLTVASPTGHQSTDDLTTNFVHIEHEHDKVSALTGASNEARLNRTTIEVQGYPAAEINAGVFGPEHNIGLIDQQLEEALNDPTVQRASDIPLSGLEMKMGGPVAIQQYRLDRQQATPPRHPFGQPRGGEQSQSQTHRAKPPKIIPVEPLGDWLTGTVRQLPD